MSHSRWITHPTAGRVRTRGRIAALLEVGAGFHEELTGRENIYLNGSIMGMKKKEVDVELEAIVDFSGMQRFLDTPPSSAIRAACARASALPWPRISIRTCW